MPEILDLYSYGHGSNSGLGTSERFDDLIGVTQEIDIKIRPNKPVNIKIINAETEYKWKCLYPQKMDVFDDGYWIEDIIFKEYTALLVYLKGKVQIDWDDLEKIEKGSVKLKIDNEEG
jgi:hypothetical protein